MRLIDVKLKSSWHSQIPDYIHSN